MVALYVDDIVIAASSKNLITKLEAIFEAKFKMKKLNKIKQLLAMGIHHDKDRNTIYVTQQQYIETSVLTYHKYNINNFTTPMDGRHHYTKLECPKEGSVEALQVKTLPYRELIETLLWISNGTRPDTAYAVNTMAKYTSNPGLVHWRAAIRILGFLNATKHYCIRCAQHPFNSNIITGGYTRRYFFPKN